MAICLLTPQSLILQNASEQRLLQNESLSSCFLTAITKGKIKKLGPDGHFTGQRKIWPYLKSRSTRSMIFFSRPASREMVEEHFLKGYERLILNQVDGALLRASSRSFMRSKAFWFHLSRFEAKHLAVSQIFGSGARGARLNKLPDRSHTEQLTSVLKAESWRLVGLQMGEPWPLEPVRKIKRVSCHWGHNQG